MIKTIYKCDKCAAEQDTADQFWSIGVWANHRAMDYSSNEHVVPLSIQVCRPCLEAFGVHVRNTNPAAAKIRSRTTEDILLELMESIGR